MATERQLEYVKLGKAEFDVSQLVLGCAPLGGLFERVAPDAATETLVAAWDAGVRTFDTAPHYGVGLAEERLGAFLATKPRREFVVSTKVGRLLVPSEKDVEGVDGFFGTPKRRRVSDFSRDGVRRSLEESCRRMGLDRVDIALIHDPDDHWEEAVTGAYPALEELRADGVVRAIGVGMNQTQMLERFVRETDIDCVLVAGRYSLLGVPVADTLLPACGEAGVAVLVGGVYKSGILADPRAGITVDYTPAPSELIERTRKIAAVCASYDVPLPAAAVQYVLRIPGVTAAVIGARSAGEAQQNAAYMLTDVPGALFAELEHEQLLGTDGGDGL